MEIVSVLRRPRRDAPPEQSEQVYLRAGIGIDGDCHASPISPRQVLLVSTGAYEHCQVPAGSLRENFLVRTDDLRLSSGSFLRVGPTAALRVTFECEACGRLNRVRGGLSRDVRGKRGYLARVVQSGVVKPGDRIKVIENVFPAFADAWKERVIGIAEMIPPGTVISYAKLAELAGVPKSFCRVFPRLLDSKPDLSSERVVSSSQLNSLPTDSIWIGSTIFADDSKFPKRLLR